MKKIILVLGLAAAVLTACGQKKDTTTSKKEAITDNLPVMEQASQTEVITRKLVFPPDESGAQQSQTVTYQGGQLKKLVIERITPTASDLQEAIKEAGMEEAQKALDQSLENDANYAQAKTVPGFTSSLTIVSENELKMTSSYDFDVLNLDQAADMPYFQAMNLKELVKLTPEEYINSLLINGAEEQK